VVSYDPSRILQYIFIVSSLGIGVFALLTGKEEKASFVRSTYNSFIGVTSVLMAILVRNLADTAVSIYPCNSVLSVIAGNHRLCICTAGTQI